MPTIKLHNDDIAVNSFSEKMKEKLKFARESTGRGGWENTKQCTNDYLSDLLHKLVGKGDPVDVANVAMMISMRGETIKAVEPDDSRGDAYDAALQYALDLPDTENGMVFLATWNQGEWRAIAKEFPDFDLATTGCKIAISIQSKKECKTCAV